MEPEHVVTANLIDIPNRTILAAEIVTEQGRIRTIAPRAGRCADPALPYVLPGFVDAHIHIESSMMVPSEFARLAVRHGTVATVSDPHEIANVMGIEGIDYMIENASRVPLKFFFGAPSCVPATEFETAGARIDAEDIERLLARDEIIYLAEMMNYPGVLADDPVVIRKLRAAQRADKPIDGHAPGLVGEQARRYIAAGITTDHECVTLEEAEFKLQHGMKILIREGSAAKNFDALYPLIDRYPQSVMLCSDDKHPDELAESHINAMVRRAIARGCDLYHVLTAACLNPVQHYRLPVGILRVGDPADFVLVDDLESWNVQSTCIDGMQVFDHHEVRFERVSPAIINRFQCSTKRPEHFVIRGTTPRVRVIKAIDHSLVTESTDVTLGSSDGVLVADPERDILKLAVVNRYEEQAPATAFVQGFGIKNGAIASSVGHDSHNILAVGSSDDHLCAAVNTIIEQRGGVAMVTRDQTEVLPLPVAGLMSIEEGASVAGHYARIDRLTKESLGSPLTSPLMTLSFMALLVIPSLKLSDRGLFDGERFQFVESPAL